MKRAYETPMAEKLAFCYRDQVVAASGEETAQSEAPTTNQQPSLNEIIGGVVNWIAREWGDLRPCFS